MKQILVLALTGISLAGLMGCGASSSPGNGSADFGSNGGTTTTTTSDKPSVFCNQAAKDDVQFSLRIYQDPSGNRNNSFVRLKLQALPVSYVPGQWDIRIKKWTVSPGGTKYPSASDPTQYVDVRFEKKASGVYSPASNWGYNLDCSACGTLQWDNMLQIAKNNGDSTDSNPITVSNFFSTYNLLLNLQDTTNTWKALTLEFVDTSGVTQRTLDILIPSFDANPSDYSANHAAILNNLHPFISMLGQNWPSSQFATMSDSYCF